MEKNPILGSNFRLGEKSTERNLAEIFGVQKINSKKNLTFKGSRKKSRSNCQKTRPKSSAKDCVPCLKLRKLL